MRERCQLGAIGNEVIERSDIEHPGVGIDAPLLHDDAVIGEPPPDTGVRFVVLVGNDDLVAFGPTSAKCLGEHVGVL